MNSEIGENCCHVIRVDQLDSKGVQKQNYIEALKIMILKTYWMAVYFHSLLITMAERKFGTRLSFTDIVQLLFPKKLVFFLKFTLKIISPKNFSWFSVYFQIWGLNNPFPQFLNNFVILWQ